MSWRRVLRGSRGGTRFIEIEIHLGSVARPFFRFEIGVVARESSDAGDQTVWKEGNVSVVVLDRFVVAAAFGGDATLRSCQLILQAHEILLRVQVRVIFK